MFQFKCTGTLEDLILLTRISNVFGLSPIMNIGTPKVSKYYKYYAAFILITIFVVGSLSFYGRIKNVYTLLPITISLVDGISLIVLTLTNVLSIYNLSINNCGTLLVVKFFEGMNFVDLKLSKYCSKVSIKAFCSELLIGHLYVIGFYIFDGYFWISYLGMSRFQTYIFRSFQNYLNFITMFMMRYYVLSLELRFRGLNTYIEEYVKQTVTAKCIYVKEDKIISKDCKRPIANIYNALCEQVEVFNKIYGLPALLLSLYFISELLVSLMLSINFVFLKSKDLDGITFGTDLFCLCFFWIIKDFVSYLKIIAPCDATICEAKRTPIICYKLLQEIAEKPLFVDKNLKSELSLVALQSSTTLPKFSAAGFFTVDFTTFFTLMGFVTSYLVVLIQFN